MNRLLLLLLLVATGLTGSAARDPSSDTPSPLWGAGGADTTDVHRVDTLREVIVDGERGLPVEQQFRRDVDRNRQPSYKTLGDLLPRSLQDKILHPFAISERRKERKRKKAQKVMEEYDRRKADQDLFEEIVRRQREEDEKNGMTNWQQIEKK